MLPNSKLVAFRSHVRLVLAVMVAVIASMTLHHGAMAQAPIQHVHVATNDYLTAQDADCKSGCPTHAHLFPACCGMGLCLSGLLAAPQSFVPAVRYARLNFERLEIEAVWSANRIDRPPKLLVELLSEHQL